jgi:hypothetical protein
LLTSVGEASRHPFVLVVSAILVVGYAYIAIRLTATAPVRAALAAPFTMVWILPVVHWFGDRDRRRVHEWVQALSFLCMGWLSFLLVLRGRVRTSRPTATRGRPSVCFWRAIRRSRRWPSRPASTCSCPDTRTPASSSRGHS